MEIESFPAMNGPVYWINFIAYPHQEVTGFTSVSGLWKDWKSIAGPVTR